MKKTIRGWAIFHPKLGILWDTIRESRAWTIEVIKERNYDKWGFLRDSLGYRIRRITVSWEE